MLAAAAFGQVIVTFFVFLGAMGLLLIFTLLFVAYITELKGLWRRLTFFVLCFLSYKSLCQAILHTDIGYLLIFFICVGAIKVLIRSNSNQ